MLQARVIPVLLLRGKGLVKTIKYDKATYIGDPINAIRIFNEKEVDELVLLDIDASKNRSKPNFEMIKSVASECFMPLGYGGGISNIDDIKQLFEIGVEKVIINTAALINMNLIKEASTIFGNQSIVVSIDIKKSLLGRNQIFSHAKVKHNFDDLFEFAIAAQNAGAGEIIINSVDKDGTMTGYDYKLIQQISKATKVPIVACGGAGHVSDFKKAVEAGASGVAAGSLFIYHGPHKGVLINYPTQKELKQILN